MNMPATADTRPLLIGIGVTHACVLIIINAL